MLVSCKFKFEDRLFRLVSVVSCKFEDVRLVTVADALCNVKKYVG